MKWLLPLTVFLLAVVAANAQATAASAECPTHLVCLTPTEMKFYLGRDDAAKAFEKEAKALRLAIEGDPSAT